jgi:RHS repeat-associated protein
VWTASEENVYWGSRLVAKRIGVSAMGHFITDRLHSKGDGSAFYPYGESKTGAAGDDREQFATYTRDQSSGLDYADQRWYSSRLGRFTSVDPIGEFGPQSADAKSPTTWAKFSYTNSDSVNGIDRNGTWPSFLDILVGHLFAPPTSVTVTTIAPKKVSAINLIAGTLSGLAYETPELIAPIGYSPDADYYSCMEESFRHVEAHKAQFDQEAAQRSYLDWEDAEGAVIRFIATEAAKALVRGGTLTPVTLQVSALIGSLGGGPVGAASAIALMAVVQASTYIISNHMVGEPALKYLYNVLVYTPSLHEVSSQCSAIWSSSPITQ